MQAICSKAKLASWSQLLALFANEYTVTWQRFSCILSYGDLSNTRM